MDFVLILLINIAILALMYLALRHQLQKNYSSEHFLETLQKEVNGIMTDLNRTAEMNVQIMNNEAEKLKALQERVEKRIGEMQQIFSMLDREDSRYQDILTRKKAVTPQTVVTPPDPPPAPPPPPKEKEDTVASTTSADPRERILGLYSQGRSIQEIADLTQFPVGEVELIINYSK